MSALKNHYLKFFSFFFSFIIANSALSQNNILIFDPEKGDFVDKTEPIPFGEQILINGSSKSNPKNVSVKSIFGISEITSEASINGNRWSVKVGPFPKRTNIIFEVTEKSPLSKAETEEIIEYWENSIVSAIENALDSVQTFTNEEDFFNKVFNPLKEEFLKSWNSYFLENGQNLATYIISLMETEIIDNWDDWYSYSSALREKKNILNNSKFVNDFLKPNKNKAAKIAAVLDAEDPADVLFNLDGAQLDSLFIAIIEASKDEKLTPGDLKTIFDSEIQPAKTKYDEGVAFLESEINKLSLIRSQTIVLTHFASAETLGLESYLGVDLGAVYTHNTSTTNFFVNLNPYLKKTDPEKDYPLFAKGAKDGNILHNLTPSVGFGIGSGVENIKPVYFVGLGLRINKAIRFGFGGTYFLSNETNEYDWNPSFYGSISINFISDLFRLINSASTNIQN